MAEKNDSQDSQSTIPYGSQNDTQDSQATIDPNTIPESPTSDSGIQNGHQNEDNK